MSSKSRVTSQMPNGKTRAEIERSPVLCLKTLGIVVSCVCVWLRLQTGFEKPFN